MTEPQYDSILAAARRGLRITHNLLGFAHETGDHGERLLVNDLVGVTCGLIQQTLPPMVELQMELEAWEAAERSLGEALAIYERSQHRYRGLALYQLAQTAARRGRPAATLQHLRGAIDAGYTRWDPDAPAFAGLRENPEFARLVATKERPR